MGYDYSIFVYPVPTIFVCPYCQLVYREPKTGTCGHILCNSCWVSKYQMIICPICPQTHKDEGAIDITDNTDIESFTLKLPTFCEYESCTERVLLENREDHIRDCQHGRAFKRKSLSDKYRSVTDKKKSRRSRLRKMKKFFIKYTISMCVTGALATFGLSKSSDLDDSLSTPTELSTEDSEDENKYN